MASAENAESMKMFVVEQLADNVFIFNGDCREVIPTLEQKIDAVVSDPPYGIEDLVVGYGRSQLAAVGLHHLNIHNDKNLDVVVEALNLIKAKYNTIWLALFYSCRISPVFFQATDMLDYFGEIVWDKKAMGLGSQIRYQHENVGVFKIGNPSDLASCSSVLTYMPLKGEQKTVHPHEKPNQVMHNLCSVVPGQMILDPFMGTGSTGAAAVQLKRGFVGIELDPRYFDLARTKIEAAIKQPVAFWE